MSTIDMSKEATARSAMKLALEALENAEYGDYDKTELNKAIISLRKELARQESTAWVTAGPHTVPLVTQPAQQEPVHQFRKRGCSDWYDGHPDHTDGGGPYEARTLYTSPPAQRKPLTDEEIDALWLQHDFIRAPDRKRQAFARAIEAKLKEKNT